MTMKAALRPGQALITIQSGYADEAVRLESIEALRDWRPTDLSTQQMPAGNTLTWDGTREVKRVQIFKDANVNLSGRSWPDGVHVYDNEGQLSITAPTTALAVEVYEQLFAV